MVQHPQSDERILEAKINRYKARARKIGVEVAWLWLCENGFAHRVPEEARLEIEEAELKGGGHENDP